MDKKVKLAVLALLGFSTACSTVRPTSSGRSEKDSIVIRPYAEVDSRPRTMVMYGVRSPEMGDTLRLEREQPTDGKIFPPKEKAPGAPEKTQE